ncbi:hypothetical protein CTI12_AA587100 [Artemisia annua]|uniref:Uncharacterized protein n=1 Tax=Artemisia annua TaxID=35608 RepID=A0A2U1KM12_ARTAN|nr:hypothetical protein CTI12_AA587100 [Artemisia annua]
MVRHFPKGESPQHDPSLSHAIFTFAFIAATIAIVSFLCGKKKRKRSLSSKKPTPKAEENTEVVVSTTPTNNRTNEATHVDIEDKKDSPPPTPPTNNRTNEATHVDIEDKKDSPPPPESTIQEEIKELPPPPRLASIRASSYHVPSSSKTFHNAKLTSSMSMRLSGRFKGLNKKGSKRYDNDENLDNDKLTREDSVWKKTIILGERCRIPDEDDDDIILDENGQRITTFHRKQSCSSSISRQSSDVNQRCEP